jgi:hypothetical protein
VPQSRGGEAFQAQQYDLSGVEDRQWNEKDALFSVRFGSYVGASVVAAVTAIEEVCKGNKLTTIRPQFLDVWRLEDAPDTVGLVPSVTETTSSLPVRWVNKGTEARIGMRKLLKARNFTIPTGTRAYLPITIGKIVGPGNCLILHFGEVSFGPVEERPKRSAKNQQQAGQRGAAPDPGDQKPDTGASQKGA